MKRILAVDDDPSILLLEEKILRQEGYEVFTAADGAAAVAMFQEHEFDLILLDVMMPGIDGFEVSRSFRRAGKQASVPVIFVTAKDDADSMREGFRSGGTVFLSKPFTATQLIRVVSSMIDR